MKAHFCIRGLVELHHCVIELRASTRLCRDSVGDGIAKGDVDCWHRLDFVFVRGCSTHDWDMAFAVKNCDICNLSRWCYLFEHDGLGESVEIDGNIEGSVDDIRVKHSCSCFRC